MTGIRFEVEDTFDVTARGGLTVVGALPTGVLMPGTSLTNEATGGEVRVLAIDFATPTSLRDGRFSVLVDRDAAEHVHPGAVLIGDGDGHGS